MIRYEIEINENKRLIEKQQKIDSIVETLKIQNVDDSEINEIKSMMSPLEFSQIKHLQDVCDK